MASIIDRVKELRRVLNLSQSDFAEALKLKRNSITLIETGKRGLSDRTISDICREFKVREEWLRNGVGEIFEEHNDDLDYMMAKYGYDLSDTQKAIVLAMLKMNDAQRAALDVFIDNLLLFRNKTE